MEIRRIAQDRPEVALLTDDRGRASFTDLVPGRYVIVIDRLGYGEARTSLTVSASSLTAVTVELAPEVLKLEPIIVTTTQRGTAALRIRPLHHEGKPGNQPEAGFVASEHDTGCSGDALIRA